MRNRLFLGITALTFACHAKPDVSREQSADPRTIDIAVPTERMSLPRALIADRLANDILSTVHGGDSSMYLSTGSAAILTREGFVVSDGHALHIFNSEARLISTHGRDGEGPGEYRYLRSMCYTSGDTLVVFDTGLNRVSILAPDGTFLRSFSVGSGSVHARNACLNDGTFIVNRYRARHQFTVHRYGLDGEVRDSTLALSFDSSLGGLQIMAEPTLAAFDDSILFGDPWNGSVSLYDERGSLHQTLKLVGLDPGMIPEDMPMYARPRSGESWNVPAKVKNFPYFQHIRVAPNGVLWYNDFPRNKYEPIRWHGFTRDGNRVGSIELDSSVVANQMVSLEDFGATSVLLRIEHETRGAIFRIVPLARLQSSESGKRN